MGGNTWCKKRSTFDVTMGSFDGAETCELVGLYLLSQLQHLNIDVGLYRDDGLAVTKQRPRDVELKKKKNMHNFPREWVKYYNRGQQKNNRLPGRHPRSKNWSI